MTYTLKQWFILDSGDVNTVGEELGFDWNAVTDAISEAELYGEDGYVAVSRRDSKHWKDGVLKTIFEHLFTQYPNVDAFRVMN